MKHKNISRTRQGYYIVIIRRTIDGKEVTANQNFRTLEEAIAGRDQILKNFEETGVLKNLKEQNKLHNIHKVGQAYHVDVVRTIDGEQVRIYENYRTLEDAITARDYILDVYKRTGKLVNYMIGKDRAIYNASQRLNVEFEDIIVTREGRNHRRSYRIGFYCKNCDKPVATDGQDSPVYRDLLCQTCRTDEIEERNQRILDQVYEETGSYRIKNICWTESHGRFKLDLQRHKEHLIVEIKDLDRLLRIKEFALSFYDTYRRLPSREEVAEAERSGEF